MGKAAFAAGCFWGVQKRFDQVKGVVKTTVGYSGGMQKDPTYRQVCSGKTGHAEAIEIEFDPKKVSYEKLLEVFWSIHNPTTRDRQGVDIGSQYRSVIFYYTKKQKQAAAASMKKEQMKHKNPIVTQIVPAKEFYPAEEYHQKYYKKSFMEKIVCGINWQ